MALHKKDVDGAVTDTLTYLIPTEDAYGGQVYDVLFYDANGDMVTPTSGS